MPRSLSRSSNLDALRGEAKRWLKAITTGDPKALARFRTVSPEPTVIPKLRQVQHALAREYGFESWAVLKLEIEDRARTAAERVRLVLEKSVNRYGTDPSTQSGDPRFSNPLGQTPAEAARRRGLDEAAALLEEAAKAPK